MPGLRERPRATSARLPAVRVELRSGKQHRQVCLAETFARRGAGGFSNGCCGLFVAVTSQVLLILLSRIYGDAPAHKLIGGRLDRSRAGWFHTFEAALN